VKPVPPVMMMPRTSGVAIQAETIARIR